MSTCSVRCHSLTVGRRLHDQGHSPCGTSLPHYIHVTFRSLADRTARVCLCGVFRVTTLIACVRVAFQYLDDRWDVAREPLHVDPPIRDAGIRGKSSYPMGTGLGLGYSFARELLASGGVDGPIGLVPCAYGGSPLSRWERQPGLADEWVGNAINIVGNGPDAVDGDLYARMIRRTRLALERPNCVLRGVLW